MPSLLHEALLELVRHNPPLIGKLLKLAGVEVPAFDRARVDDSALNEPRPVVRSADMVATVHGLGALPEDQTTILECRDTSKLEGWLDRVLSVASVDELLGEAQ